MEFFREGRVQAQKLIQKGGVFFREERRTFEPFFEAKYLGARGKAQGPLGFVNRGFAGLVTPLFASLEYLGRRWVDGDSREEIIKKSTRTIQFLNELWEGEEIR